MDEQWLHHSRHNRIHRIFIKPSNNGSVKIYSSYTFENTNGQIDTITFTDRFKAITPPNLKILINTTLLRDSCILDYDIVFARNSRPIHKSRYQLGGLPPDISVFFNETQIGDIAFYTEKEEALKLLKEGNNIIIPPIPIRDTKTGLLTFTDSLHYNYKRNKPVKE